MKKSFKFFEGKNKKKVLTLGLMLFALLVTSSVFIGKGLLGENKKEKVDISVVLEKAEYSYLPVEAKNYIKVVYEETGQVLLTEKNKEKGQPYLNPKFVTYLSMSSDERQKEALIPEEVIVDYVYDAENTVNSDSIPSKFDLRNMDSVTPLKNQGDLGICWAFATNGQAEGYLLAQDIVDDLDSAKMFSERQLDYVTSLNGIEEYYNEFAGYRNLGSGGNFRMAIYPMISGLGLVDVSWKEYDDTDYQEMEAYEVFNFRASQYEVNSTVDMPQLDFSRLDLSNKEDLAQRDNYLNTIKAHVKEYGGAYVGTQAPGYSCSAENFLDEAGSYIIREDDTCSPDGDHAMLIIGWDDDYEYSYCENGSTHVSGTSCSESEKLVTGKGAWLLKNSWGEKIKADYAYLAYDSLNVQISVITNMEDNSSKNWDNVYFDNYLSEPYIYLYSNYDSYVYPSVDGINEKVTKVKFHSYSQDSTYNLYVKNGSSWDLVQTMETTLPGIYTFDLSKNNIVTTDEGRIVLRIITDGMFSAPFFIYTDNIEQTLAINTYDIDYENNLEVDSDSYYEMRIFSDTRNISSMEKVDYKLFDSNGNDVSDYLSYSDNYVAHNVVNASAQIDSNIGLGEYTLQTIYSGEVLSESVITLEERITVIEGSGTANDPYVITSEEELKLIEQDLNAYYILGNDITLQEDWVPLGYKNESGFTGQLDGNGYKILGLNVGEDFMFNGLFAAIAIGEDHDTVVKNLVIDDADVTVSSNEYSGILSGFVSDNYFGLEYNEPYSICIDNISIINSYVSYSYAAGALFGAVEISRNDSLIINNVFSDSLVSAKKYVGGIIGRVLPSVQGAESLITLSNIQNVGSVMSNESLPRAGDDEEGKVIASHLFGYLGTDVSLSNVLLTSSVLINDSDIFGSIAGQFERNGSLDINNSINNVYYFDDYDNVVGVSNSGVNITGSHKKDIVELTDETLYSSWKDFSIYWNKFTPSDGIPRIPILASQQTFDYTTLSKSNFNLFVGQQADLSEAFDVGYRLSFEMEEEFATVYREDLPYVFNILKNGDTFVSVVSNHDGYKNTIPVNISDDNVNLTITFHSNYAEDETYTQSFNDLSYNARLEENRFSREGYRFYEWTTNFDGSGNIFIENEYINPSYFDSDFDLYANWLANEYIVKYDANGASGQGKVPNQSFVYDQSDRLFKNLFTKEGYKFIGWNTEADGTGQMFAEGQEVINLTSTNKATVVLYAQWKIIGYSVSFDANGGTGVLDSQEFNFNSKEKLNLNKFERIGYQFVGWNTNSDGSGISYSDGQEVVNLSFVDDENIVLYAQWSPIKYSIRFDKNGGVGSEESYEFIYDQVALLPDIGYTKDGYNLVGWNTLCDGTGTSYVFGAEILNFSNVEQELVLYAQWSPITYFVSFDSNGGVGEMSLQEFIYGQSINLSSNLFVREGYKFSSWNSKEDGSGISYSEKEAVKDLFNLEGGVVTLYAQWTPIKYAIGFNANGGTGQMEPQEVVYDKSVSLNANLFKKEGYEFLGWSINNDGTDTIYLDKEEVINLTSNEETVILYAQWTPISYIVSFDSNGGEGEMNSQRFVYDLEESLIFNNYIKSGYEFVGWNSKVDGTGESYIDGQDVSNLTSSNEEVILYAQWTPIKYTVSFDANGGEGEIALQEFSYDLAGKLNINVYNKVGYVFKEWNNMPDGSGVSYQDEQEIINLTDINEVITLYAQWIPIEYVVNFNSNGGEGTLDNQVFIYDMTNYLNKNIFTRVGYKFEGWNTESDGSGVSYVDEAEVSNLTTVNEDVITLYAQWNPISYSVRFNGNGGEGEMEIVNFVYDEVKRLPENAFIKEGYEIKEWNTKRDGTGTSYKDKASVKNLTANEETITLYVIWKVEITYEIIDYEFDDYHNLTKIDSETTLEKYLKNIIIGNKYSIKVFDLSGDELKNNDLIFTGSTTKIYFNGEVQGEFVNIIYGDIDADGSVIVSDISKLYRFTKGKVLMNEAYNLIAADVDGDDVIDVADIAKIYRYTKNKIETLY